MSGLQRIWMLCLLVIAGSGPLPLWLHHIVCHGTVCHGTVCHETDSHGTDSHGTDSHGTACHGNSLQVLTPAPAHDHANCGGHHDHVTTPAGKVPAKAQLESTWRVAGDSHEDCAICYTLSQLTTAQPTKDVLVSLLRTQYVCPAGDSQASLQTWLAYSSRGPPTG